MVWYNSPDVHFDGPSSVGRGGNFFQIWRANNIQVTLVPSSDQDILCPDGFFISSFKVLELSELSKRRAQWKWHDFFSTPPHQLDLCAAQIVNKQATHDMAANKATWIFLWVLRNPNMLELSSLDWRCSMPSWACPSNGPTPQGIGHWHGLLLFAVVEDWSCWNVCSCKLIRKSNARGNKL